MSPDHSSRPAASDANYTVDCDEPGYATIFTDPTKVRFFLNSYFVSLTVTLLTLLVAILASFAFSRYEFPLKRVLNVMIIGVQAVPPITLLIPYFGLSYSWACTTPTKGSF